MIRSLFTRLFEKGLTPFRQGSIYFHFCTGQETARITLYPTNQVSWLTVDGAIAARAEMVTDPI